MHIRPLPFSPSLISGQITFIRAACIPSFFLDNCLGRFSALEFRHWGQSLNPLPEFSDHLKHRSCPLLASSPSRACSANPTNDITATAFCQTHRSVSCQV